MAGNSKDSKILAYKDMINRKRLIIDRIVRLQLL